MRKEAADAAAQDAAKVAADGLQSLVSECSDGPLFEDMRIAIEMAKPNSQAGREVIDSIARVACECIAVRISTLPERQLRSYRAVFRGERHDHVGLPPMGEGMKFRFLQIHGECSKRGTLLARPELALIRHLTLHEEP